MLNKMLKIPKKAWKQEREFRRAAMPPFIRSANNGAIVHPSVGDAQKSSAGWKMLNELARGRRAHLFALWYGNVPGSRAPERLQLEMVQAWENRGYDVSEAELLLSAAIEARKNENWGELELITAQIKRQIREAPKDEQHQYWKYRHPDDWKMISTLAPGLKNRNVTPRSYPKETIAVLRTQIENAWYGQIAAASWGTALEGYCGAVLEKHFGERLAGYVIPPETYNDDIVYELAFLAACEAKGAALTSSDIGSYWLKMIPLGWSAEQCALDNLRAGYMPPVSATLDNPFSEWVGGQMRGMVCGLIAPYDPAMAAYLAWLDGTVSHQANGIYGEMYSAVIVSLAFQYTDTHRILQEAAEYIPHGTWFHSIYEECLEMCHKNKSVSEIWSYFDSTLQKFNWIHTFPNMVATVLALWHGNGDFNRSLQILAHCGLDVDCNAGVVGTVLGVIKKPSDQWCDPIAGGVDTYLLDYPHLEISELVEWTVRAIKARRGPRMASKKNGIHTEKLSL